MRSCRSRSIMFSSQIPCTASRISWAWREPSLQSSNRKGNSGSSIGIVVPREETRVFGQPRGPRTEMRMEARDVAVIVEPAGLSPNRTVEFPPYHYGAMFRDGEGMSDGLHNSEAFR